MIVAKSENIIVQNTNMFDFAATFGGYLALGLYIAGLIAPYFVFRFMVQIAEIIKDKYKEQYRTDLADTIHKYQIMIKDINPISDHEDIRDLESRFDKVTGLYLNNPTNPNEDHTYEPSAMYNTGTKFLGVNDEEFLQEGGEENFIVNHLANQVEYDLNRLKQ